MLKVRLVAHIDVLVLESMQRPAADIKARVLSERHVLAYAHI